MTHNTLLKLGFIGLGAMGGPMVHNLLQAGYTLCGFDLDADRMAACVVDGMVAAKDVASVVAQSDIIMTSLPSSQVFVNIAENEVLPHLRPGQIIIDLGTTVVTKFRELAARFATLGVELLDAPVSGGPGGVMSRQLYMFLGGREEIVHRCMPIFIAIGGEERITYCGPPGCGQVVKGVNQLMMGLGNAAYLEALAFGVNAGVDASIIRQAMDATGRWRVDFNNTATQVSGGRGEDVGVKFRELPYFLQAAADSGFALPLTEMLYQFCEHGERVVIDDNRPAPSFWHELLRSAQNP